jgi:hypothetical protein
MSVRPDLSDKIEIPEELQHESQVPVKFMLARKYMPDQADFNPVGW